VNRGWVLAACIAADLAAWCRLLGLYDQDDLKDAEPDTLRRLWHLPARLTSHPVPATREGAAPARSEPVPPRAHRAAPPPVNQTPRPKTGTTRSVTNLARTLNHRG
jgi:hypothetical protein